MKPHVRWLACAAILPFAACSLDSTGPAAEDAYVSTLLSEIGITGMAGSVGGVVMIPQASRGPADCSYVASNQRFVCAPFSLGNGLTITREYAFYDEAGTPLPAADRARIASLRQWTHVSGTLTGMNSDLVGSSTIDRRDDMTLSGLLTSRHTLNGTAAGTVSRRATVDGATSTILYAQADTTREVVFATPSAATPSQPSWPLGGSITSWTRFTGIPGAPETVFGHRIEFSGTSVITMTSWTPFGTRTCTIDLARPVTTSGVPREVCT
jgi:hypothetical protein